MTHRPDHFAAGRQLLELQLAMMKGAMTLMADSAQRLVELGLGPAASGLGATRAARQGPTRMASPAASSQPRVGATGPAPAARTGRPSPGGKDYALRVQEDLDSILHAFAMVPDAADRLIRASALLAEKPGNGRESRTSPPARTAPAHRPRRQSTEHAR